MHWLDLVLSFGVIVSTMLVLAAGAVVVRHRRRTWR